MTKCAAPRSESPLFIIEDAPGAGRGVFARRNIAKGETIFTADDLSIHVLFREYRGEICYHCFAYDQGEKQPVKDAIHGLAFCSGECKAAYLSQTDELCLAARVAIEKLIKVKSPRSPEIGREDDGPRPSVSDIAKAWEAAEAKATSIRVARALGTAGKVSKSDLKSLQRAISTPVTPDVLTFLLSAVLRNYHSQKAPSHWALLLELEAESTPYLSATELKEYVASYLHLVAVLPDRLLPFVSSEMLHAVKTRETHNSFGIRSLGDEGSEFFGYGVWPSASYFNHSCDQNLQRQRRGRTWVFSAKRDIIAGEQLYISYVSSEDSGGEALGWRERSAYLKKTWGFDCACERCGRERDGDL